MEEILLPVLVLVLPLLGTALGAGLVLFIPGGRQNHGPLCALSAGAMLASAIWSLLLPALELGLLACAAGFALGMTVLILPDRMLSRYGRQMAPAAALMLAVVLHNIPEGMAVGAGYAGFLSCSGVSAADVLTLSLGIGVQNIPDGAVAALPLAGAGTSKKRAFCLGAASGLVEPLAALLMTFFAPIPEVWLPLLMGFSAGAMVCVVIRELIPRMQESPAGTLFFTAGFLALMVIDVLWG